MKLSKLLMLVVAVTFPAVIAEAGHGGNHRADTHYVSSGKMHHDGAKVDEADDRDVAVSNQGDAPDQGGITESAQAKHKSSHHKKKGEDTSDQIHYCPSCDP